MMENQKLDFVIFGATGFTGKYTVKEAARLAKEKHLTFGVSGRRKEALEAVVHEFASGIEKVPIIIADVKNEESLQKMAEQAKVVVNCCGPYRFYGEPVVKACIATHTHYVDVSGEPLYIEEMQLKYNEVAKEAGIYIISACGFDSIPCDLGVVFTQDKFEGQVNSIESYLNCWSTTNVKGPVINYGTWETAVYGIAQANKMRPLRSKLYPERLPSFWPKLKSRFIFHRSPISGGWSTIFQGSDRSVAMRTQRYFYDNYKERPAQIQTYWTFSSISTVFLTAIIGVMILLLTKFECGRNLLLKYPRFFSGGVISDKMEGPKKEVMENAHFAITFKALGWSEKLAAVTDKYTEAPNKGLITKVTGVNPGYGTTCTTLLLAAITILKESDKMPEKGGVLPPGAAFKKTSIIEELNKNGLKFEVITPEVISSDTFGSI